MASLIRDRIKQDVGKGYLDFPYALPFHYHFLPFFEVVTWCAFDRCQIVYPAKPSMRLELSVLHQIRGLQGEATPAGLTHRVREVRRQFTVYGKGYAPTMCQIGTSVLRSLQIPIEYFQHRQHCQ